MIDPVKLAKRHKDAIGVCERLAENNHGETILAVISETADFHRDTATALRLLSAYAEAAGDEIRAWRAFFPSALAIEDGGTRTDAARAALEAAGIRVGGGA